MKRSLCNSLLLSAGLLLLTCGPGKRAKHDDGGEVPRARDGRGIRQEAPHHHAPDQDRIDSLKEEKQRERDRPREP
ncbi:MAG: hypothetical protein KIT10_04070 [Flavobacteriales bacterium]|nr:hypothetical protein [Flavobacteriales bacterium]